MFEGRAVIDGDRTRGRQLLGGALQAARSDGGRELGLVRLLAYRRLTSDAVKAAELPRALSLIADELDLEPPEGCLLAISEDLRKAAVVARTADGRLVGSFGQPALAAHPELVVPDAIRKALAGCPQVPVLALPPFRGKARLLDDGTAWHHLGRAAPAGAGWAASRRLVVSDVSPPASFGLPILPVWRSSGKLPISRHLRGSEANPVTVLRELPSADLIEFHVHALSDFKVAEAPYLVLSPDARGQARLQADAVEALDLPRRPFVVLAACNSAASSPYFPSSSGLWSFPAAFLRAGARAVLAANEEIPDGEATAFVEQMVERVQRGQPAAIALRDARVSWMTRPDSGWVREMVLFQ